MSGIPSGFRELGVGRHRATRHGEIGPVRCPGVRQ